MKTIIVVAAFIASILIASAFGLGLFNQMTQKPQSTPTPLAIATAIPTQEPTSTPAPTLIPTPAPTPLPSVYIAAPAKPEFTLQVNNYSYTTPSQPEFDPYKNITSVIPGEYIENYTLVVTIKNQPFTSISLPDGNKTDLCYLIYSKGHYENWSDYNSGPFRSDVVKQSTSGYTVITFNLIDEDHRWILDAGDVADLRVKAQIGYFYQVLADPPYWAPHYWESSLVTSFKVLAESAWSDSQIVPNPNPHL